MANHDVLQILFRDEHKRIIAELRYQFSIAIEIAEDLAGDTFLAATEFWKRRGLPQNPTAWLYTVARNKARNYLKKRTIFDKKLSPQLKRTPATEEIEFDICQKPITDNQLAMMFAICNPCISDEAQIGLGLHVLCGVGIQEIADAFSTTKHVIYKRLERAKERLKTYHIKIQQPTPLEICERMENVLSILYLLFSQGHFSSSMNNPSRMDFAVEAMRMNYLLIEHQKTSTPAAHALFAWMCFHASKPVTGCALDGSLVSCRTQNDTFWDDEMIAKGIYHLNLASSGTTVTRYHLEAADAYEHTRNECARQKRESMAIDNGNPVGYLSTASSVSNFNWQNVAAA